MDNRITKIFNGHVITPGGIIKDGSVVVQGNSILEVVRGNPECPDAIEIDAKGKYVSPGFIDIHVHGGGGFDFMDATQEAFLKIAEFHSSHGTTSLYPTTLTSTRTDILEILDVYERVHAKKSNGAQLLGMHLEGPYFAMNQRGAQNSKYIRDPDPDEYIEILSKSKQIARWSSAPELRGALEMGRFLRERGVLPAIAHTDAIYEEVLEAFNCGYTLITHLYSAMSGVTRKNAYRYAGVIESAFIIDKMDVEVIGDGIHVPAPLLKLIYKIKGPDKIALVTDAMRGAGMPSGNSVIGSMKDGLAVIIEDGIAKLPDRSSFAGSVATGNMLVERISRLAEVPLIDAIKMATATPARIMGISDTKGELMPGKDADIVVFDSEIAVWMTMVKGRVVYSCDRSWR